MLSPILRRLCVTSSESSTEEIEAEELPEEKKEKDEKEAIEAEQPPLSPRPRPDIEAADSRAISSALAKTEKMHQQHHHHRRFESSYSQVSSSVSRSKSHQQTLTKDEARKRMMSWRKTTRPRRESHALNSN